MKLRDRIANFLASRQANSIGATGGLAEAQRFFRFGNRGKPLEADWSPVMMTPREKYSGYIYAAVRTRANKVAQLATENLRTDATKSITDAAKKSREDVIHPYLTLIDDSKSFSNYRFWYEIPAFIDLKGVYFLMAVRNIARNGDQVRVGNVVEFQLLNPFEITRVRDGEHMEIQGYTQNHRGFVRDIPKEMILEIEDFNPFDDDDPFSMSEAAKDPHFTLKEADNFTRKSIRNNTGSPGIISTDVVLDGEALKKFKARITGQETGEPIFTDGAGKVNWNSMQIDLDKAALDKVNDISLNKLLAITGMSKTTFGIEQSGVTRDTSEVQSNQLISNHSIPRLQLIIDALNQDYKLYYGDKYDKDNYRIWIDSPLGVDRDAEEKDVTIRQNTYDLYSTLVNAGYEPELAARFSAGEITLEELGLPTLEPRNTVPLTPTRVTDTTGTPPVDTPPADTKPTKKAEEPPVAPSAASLPVVHNQLDAATTTTLNTQEAALKNAVIAVEARVVASVINKVTNAVAPDDIINAQDRKREQQDLETALMLFYGVVMPLFAQTTLNRRATELGLFGQFTLNKDVKDYIKRTAAAGADSHINTILADLADAISKAKLVNLDADKVLPVITKKYPDADPVEIVATIKRAAEAGKDEQAIAVAIRSTYGDADFEALLAAVRKAALDGASHQDLMTAIRTEYASISKTRSELIARTETNRAFTSAQYQADKQFLKQNGLTHRAYKKWVTRSDNPCEFCIAQSKRPPVPFPEAFASIGDVLTAEVELENGTTSVRKLPVTYEALEAGNAHPRCLCTYQLIVE